MNGVTHLIAYRAASALAAATLDCPASLHYCISPGRRQASRLFLFRRRHLDVSPVAIHRAFANAFD